MPFNPSRLEQRIGRIDRYGQHDSPEVFYFAPDRMTTGLYAGDAEFMQRIARKVSAVQSDLGSVNPLIDDEIQGHFTSGTKRTTKPNPKDRGAETLNRVHADSLTLNRRLTELEHDHRTRMASMHLTPFNARRVVDKALALSAQPQLREIGDADTDAEVLEVPNLGPQWQPALAGLRTRLNPEVARPITFEADAVRDRHDLVHVHLGHPLMQKAGRVLRSSLFGTEAQLHRVTAVVVDDLPESCVAAVSRLVLVGRGGLRLHEEVFWTGVRFRGQKLAADKAHEVLERALDGTGLQLAGRQVLDRLSADWNSADSRIRQRLETEVERRADKTMETVAVSLDERRDSDIERAHQVFTAFRNNLTDSLTSAPATRGAGDDAAARRSATTTPTRHHRDARASAEPGRRRGA